LRPACALSGTTTVTASRVARMGETSWILAESKKYRYVKRS